MRLKKIYDFNKIILEKLSIKHLEDIHEYSQIPSFFKYLEFKEFKHKKETVKYLKKRIKENDFESSFWWAIKLKKQNKTIGTFVIHNFEKSRASCEISYGISPLFQGHGYFKLIVNNIIKILEKNNINRIQAITHFKNKASIHGLLNCGFKKEGVLRNYFFDNKKKKYNNAVILSKV